MKYRRNKGGLWGGGIALIVLLLGIALMMWMFSTSSEVYIGSSNRSLQQLDEALEQGKKNNEAAGRQMGNKTATPATAASQPAPRNSMQKLNDGLPRQMPAHDGGMIEELSK